MVHDQGYVYPVFDEFSDPQAKLEAMDRKGIDVSVISPAPPMFYYWADADLTLKVAGLVNDGVADMVAHNPARLRGMASVPMQHPDAAVAELERVVREYVFRAIEIGTSVEGAQLAEDRFRPVLRRAAELGVFVFAHPYYVGAKTGLECYYFTNLIGNPLDTAACVANLMFCGVMDELPELKILLAHGGGFAPYQIGRFMHGHKVRNETHARSASDPKTLLRHVYFDSLVFEPQALRHLIDLVGADHIAIGTPTRPSTWRTSTRWRRSMRCQASRTRSTMRSAAARRCGCWAKAEEACREQTHRHRAHPRRHDRDDQQRPGRRRADADWRDAGGGRSRAGRDRRG